MTHSNNGKPAARSPQPSPVEAAPTAPTSVKPKATPTPQQSQQGRNKAHTRRNSAKVEQYLMDVERVHGFARSWALRERLERGEVTLEELQRR